MIDTNGINSIIFSAIDELNEGLTDGKKITKSAETILYGKESILDSFGLVNLIVGVEERVQDETGIIINLADEKALSQKNSPFLTVKSLSDYISKLLNENNHQTN